MVFALEPLYRESLFDKTIADVPKMQLKKRLQGMFEKISFVGEVEVSILMLFIIFNVMHKMKALYIWVAYGFMCFMNAGVLKSLYAESRPFWVSQDIKA